ncbi:MAG: DUF4340 domain-containing protein [Gemmatimonadales bacterium]
MNTAQLKRIVVVFVVVLLLWGTLEIVGKARDERETVSLLPAIERNDLDLVRIERESDTVELRLSADSWTVNGYAASSDAVRELFDAVLEPVDGELIATGAGVHVRMGVDSVTGKRLEFRSGEQLVAGVIFGKRGRGFNTSYVRPVDELSVYQYNGRLTSLVDRRIEDWRDKVIVQVEADSVGRVAVRRGRERFSVERVDGGWRLNSTEEADSAAVARMLERYGSVTASGFPTEAQADSVDFRRPDRAITLLGLTGDTLAALLLDSTQAGFWVRHASGGTVYKILQWAADQLVPADSTLTRAVSGG